MKLRAISAFFLALAFMTRPAVASDDPVRDSVPGTIRKLDLQTALPHVATAGDMSSAWDFNVPRGVIWFLAILCALMLAYIARDMIPGWRSRMDDGWADGAIGDPAGAVSRQASLADADMLAGQGRFVDAMHLLLLHSLAELRRRLKLEFSDSLTSREILRRATLPEDGAAALRGIVTRVELSYFGGHPAGRTEYEACRARYEDLAGILTRFAA